MSTVQLLVDCHKCILAANSSYFEQLLESTDGQAILNLDNITPEHICHVRTIVDFMYGLPINVNSKSQMSTLIDTANMFNVGALVKCAANIPSCKNLF